MEPKVVVFAPAGRFRAFVNCQRRTFRCRRCHCRNAGSKGKGVPTHLKKLDLVGRIHTGTMEGGLNGTTTNRYEGTAAPDRRLRQIDPKKRSQAPKKAASAPFRKPRRQRTETSCKPSSVSRFFRRKSRPGGHFSGNVVADTLQHATRSNPRTAGTPNRPRPLDAWNCLRLHAVGFAVPRPSPERAVRSYRTFSTLPATEVTSAVCFLWHCP